MFKLLEIFKLVQVVDYSIYQNLLDYDPCKTCNVDGTVFGYLCDLETEICTCKEGWYGYKCLFGKFSTFTIDPDGHLVHLEIFL